MLVKLKHSKLLTLKPVKKRSVSERNGKTNSLKLRPSKKAIKTIKIFLKLCLKATRRTIASTATTSEFNNLNTTSSRLRKQTKTTTLLPSMLTRSRSMSIISKVSRLEQIA